MTIAQSPGRYRTALSVLGETDLTGKVVVITGANQGIGFVTAQTLVKGGAKVISACRDVEAGKASAHSIHGPGSVVVKKLDLSDLETVDELVEDLLKEERIDYVICNAGIMMTPCWSTKDGFEAQIGTNHHGHFALVTALLDKLKKQPFPSRIIVLTSSVHSQANLDLDDLHFKKRAYDGNAAYANSKLANILFVKELAERLKGTKVTAVAVHPGVIPTQLSRHLGFSGVVFRWGLGSLMYSSEWKTPEQGAATTIYAVVSPEVEKHAGAYLADCAVQPTSNPQAEDMGLAAKLWAKTESDVKEARANRTSSRK